MACVCALEGKLKWKKYSHPCPTGMGKYAGDWTWIQANSRVCCGWKEEPASRDGPRKPPQVSWLQGFRVPVESSKPAQGTWRAVGLTQAPAAGWECAALRKHLGTVKLHGLLRLQGKGERNQGKGLTCPGSPWDCNFQCQMSQPQGETIRREQKRLSLIFHCALIFFSLPAT